MAKRNFDTFIGGFHEYCKHHESPDSYKLWSALALVAGAVEQKIWCSNGDVITYPNLYTFIVGDRGIGKTTMTNIAMNLLDELPHVNMAATKVNEASFIKKMLRIGDNKNFTYNGKTYKDSSVFVYASEAASTFKEMYQGASVTGLLTDLYNCGDRIWSDKPRYTKDTMKDGEQGIYNPCINLLACSTPAWLMTKVMKKDDIEGGFASRCIMVVHEGNFEFTDSLHEHGIEHEMTRRSVMQDLQAIAALRGPFQIKPAWHAAKKGYLLEHNARLRALEVSDKLMAGLLARKATTFLQKISMLLSAAESDAMVLEERHAHQAWQMLTELEITIPYAFQNYGESLEVKHTEDIRRWIIQAKVRNVQPQQIMQLFHKTYNRTTVREAFSDLVAQGFLQPNGTGYYVNAELAGPVVPQCLPPAPLGHVDQTSEPVVHHDGKTVY